MMPEPVVVDVEGPLQQEVAALLIQSDSVTAWLYPGEYRRPITPEFLTKSGTHVLIARLGGTAVGLCVVFERDDGTVEVKRMIVDEGARGKGVGATLLNAAHAHAKKLGAHAALLEVGTRNTEAQRLYLGAGYILRGPFLPYNPSPISVFMELPL